MENVADTPQRRSTCYSASNRRAAVAARTQQKIRKARTMSSTKRLAITLPTEQVTELKHLAADLGFPVSIIIRALLEDALSRVETKDEATAAALQDALQEETDRRAAVGREAMRSRWGKKDDDND
jgi:predicted DNA-binding protein